MEPAEACRLHRRTAEAASGAQEVVPRLQAAPEKQCPGCKWCPKAARSVASHQRHDWLLKSFKGIHFFPLLYTEFHLVLCGFSSLKSGKPSVMWCECIRIQWRMLLQSQSPLRPDLPPFCSLPFILPMPLQYLI